MFTLRPGANTTGRSLENDFGLPDITVSRQCAHIVVRPEGVWLEDLGSTVGTFVNDRRIARPIRLQPGDRLQLGGTAVLGVQVAPEVQAASPLVPPQGHVRRIRPVRARRPARRRRGLVVGSSMAAIALVGLALAALTVYRPLLGGDKYLRLPDVGDRSIMTEEEAAVIGASVVEHLCPDLAEVKPGVVQSDVQGHRIFDVAFPMGVEGGNGGFTRMVIIAIDTTSETFSVFESN